MSQTALLQVIGAVITGVYLWVGMCKFWVMSGEIQK